MIPGDAPLQLDPDAFSLHGKTALVTGCRRGIGFGLAVALAAAGADIIGVSANLEASASEISRTVEAANRRFTAYRVDFADPDAVAQFATRLVESGSQIDIVVNNAGITTRGPAVEESIVSWDRVLQVNLSSQFTLTRILAGPMLGRGHGKVIFVASMLSFQGGKNVVSYAASKSGIAGLTRALASEWAASGVNVNAIAPGYISTDFTQVLRNDAERDAQILARIPAGRWGNPSDLGGAVVFLASRASDYVHGIILPIDGGWLAR